ncbi:hypothetical protein [Streptococcus pneumoniae]|nr:hypothetical protein [Streptococcus pneumoniae]
MKKVKLGQVATFINGYAFKPQDWSSETKDNSKTIRKSEIYPPPTSPPK